MDVMEASREHLNRTAARLHADLLQTDAEHAEIARQDIIAI